MSKQHVLTFLREWLQYSNACMKAHKAGAFLPHSHPFTPYDGLCGNLGKWCDARTTNLSYDDSLEFRRGYGQHAARFIPGRPPVYLLDVRRA